MNNMEDESEDGWQALVRDLEAREPLPQEELNRILDQLKKDQVAARNDGDVSMLALALPLDPESSRVSHALAGMCSGADLAISGFIYQGILRTILNAMVAKKTAKSREPAAAPLGPQRSPLTPNDLQNALHVLRLIELEQIRPSCASHPLQSEIDKIIATARRIPQNRVPYNKHAFHSKATNEKLPQWIHLQTANRCYTCKLVIYRPSRLNPALCVACEEFNSQHTSDTHPTQFSGCTALVTGARINLGFATALRLLRGGCTQVFGTSRFPTDAQQRYAACPDYAAWRDRLQIICADFVDAASVKSLLETLGRVLKGRRLDILINNAAQTVPTPRAERQRLLRLEAAPVLKEQLFLENAYTEAYKDLETDVVLQEQCSAVSLVNGAPVKNSWTARYDEIPYTEVFSAFTINSIVPFILVRELAAFMTRPVLGSDIAPSASSAPIYAFITNVSSREGIFLRKDRIRRSGHHVHTNMAKASFNMLTETLADEFEGMGILMNSVDPGYLSHQHGEPSDQQAATAQRPCPLSWEDGAARVLFPVVSGLRGEKHVGKFFKDYQERMWHD